jgi:hypothetical protein
MQDGVVGPEGICVAAFLANLWQGPFVVVDGANAGTTALAPSI